MICTNLLEMKKSYPLMARLCARAENPTAPVVTDYLKEVIESDEISRYLEEVRFRAELSTWVAARSYRHPNGFDKIVLWRGVDSSRLRLHLWVNPTGELGDVHDHFWDFASVVIFGYLQSEVFEVSDMGEIVAARFRLLRMPVPDEFSLEFVGSTSLHLMSAGRIARGECQVLKSDVLHRVWAPRLSMAATLMLQGPPLIRENNVFSTSEVQMKQRDSRVEHFTSETLDVALLKVATIMAPNPADRADD